MRETQSHCQKEFQPHIQMIVLKVFLLWTLKKILKLFKLIEVGWTVINLHSVLFGKAAAAPSAEPLPMASTVAASLVWPNNKSLEWRGTLKTCLSIVAYTKVTTPPGYFGRKHSSKWKFSKLMTLLFKRPLRRSSHALDFKCKIPYLAYNSVWHALLVYDFALWGSDFLGVTCEWDVDCWSYLSPILLLGGFSIIMIVTLPSSLSSAEYRGCSNTLMMGWGYTQTLTLPTIEIFYCWANIDPIRRQSTQVL